MEMAACSPHHSNSSALALSHLPLHNPFCACFAFSFACCSLCFFSPYVRRQLVRLYHTHMRRALPTSGGLPLANALRVASSYLAGGLPNSGRHRILTALTALERMYSCSKPSCTGGQSSLAPHSFNPVAHSFPNPRYFEHQVSQFCLVHSYNMVCGGPVIDPLHVLSFAVNHILPTSAAQCRWDAGFHPKKGLFSNDVLSTYISVSRPDLPLIPDDPLHPSPIPRGSTRSAFLEHIPPGATSVLLQWDVPYGHSVCLRQTTETGRQTWLLLDSELVSL